jgi:excisionase family DNA binding protein
VSAIHLELPDDALDELAQRVAAILAPRFARSEGASKRWFTVPEAADYIGAQPQRIYDLRSNGTLSRTGDGARALVDRAELDRYLENGARGGV